MFKMKKTPARALTYEQALSRATRLCSGGEHGRHEMEEKACLWGLTALEARRLADYLEAERYVDDAVPTCTTSSTTTTGGRPR